MRFPFLMSILLLLGATACSQAPSTDLTNEPKAEPSQASAELEVDNILVNTSCDLVLGAYERWAGLDEESLFGAPGKVARENFTEALQTVWTSATDLYGLKELGDIHRSVDPQAVSFSDAEALAGMVNYWSVRWDNPSFDWEKQVPTSVFYLEFRSQIERRCEARLGTDEAEAAESVKAEILTLGVFNTYQEAIDAFLTAGGSCDRVLDEVYCQSTGEEFQARFWIWDEPRLELPEADDDLDVIVGKNWELWINPALRLDVDSIAGELGGLVVR